MQSISDCPDIQGDCDWLCFWTRKDFQLAFALTQVEIDYSRKTNYLSVLDEGQAVRCLRHNFSIEECDPDAFENVQVC